MIRSTPLRIDFQLARNPMYWLAWTAAAFYNACRDVFSGPLAFLLVFNAAHFFLWACLGLVAIPLIRRFPIRLHWRPWLLHVLLGSLFTLVDIFFGHWISERILGVELAPSLRSLFMLAFQTCFHLGLLTYILLVAVVQGLDAHAVSVQRAVRGVQLEAELVQAQLQSLRSQLQPHFLFNTLHAISSLMHYDVPTADRMLNRLGDLLRLSLQKFGTQLVCLSQEMAYLQAYLDIEKLRFEHRLHIRWEIDPRLSELDVPPFLLQPLVENAIKHGISPCAAGGTVVIRAYAQGSDMLLEVQDDGGGHPSAQPGLGIGMRNIRARLETLYGKHHALDLLRLAEGTLARVRLPLSMPMPTPMLQGAQVA